MLSDAYSNTYSANVPSLHVYILELKKGENARVVPVRFAYLHHLIKGELQMNVESYVDKFSNAAKHVPSLN